jgi:hypothetical protein
MLLPILRLLIDVTFSTPTPYYTHRPSCGKPQELIPVSRLRKELGAANALLP